MKNLIQDTLSRIKTEHIAPEPKWKFLLRKAGAWVLVGAVVLLGAAAIAAAYYLISQLDWDLYRFTRRSPFAYVLPMIPYFWLILLGAFILAAFFGVRRTESGYRFSGLWVVVLVVVGIALAGFLMARAGFGSRLDGMMRGVPFYARSIETQEKQWMQPEEGFLAGTVRSASEGAIDLNDLDGEQWNVKVDEKTLVRPAADVSTGQMIKIIGTKQSARDFSAAEIRPWMGHGMAGAGSGQDNGCGAGKSGSCGNRGNMMRGR
ncbi:MAG: hypothetical protein U0944_03650 [Candidatus Moranbacteria bacterium]|nr:hypothetical protein [Candidatus Moranbacteria bacterium]